MRTLDIIRKDIYRCTGGNKKFIQSLYYNPALYSLIFFRFSQRIDRIKISILRIIIKSIFTRVIFKLFEIVLGIEISSLANIEPGLYIGHFGNIFIGPVKIGKNCNISQGVTIGVGAFGTPKEGLPSIGDNVYIGPGSVLFGNICIGNNVSIGANAVVTKDIPDSSIVVGNPARIVGYQQKNIYIQNPIT